MTHVRRHERQTAAGKTTTVRAHERDTGDGPVVSEAPAWAQPARPADFGPVPLAPTTWTDEDTEPAGDWWDDELNGEEVQPAAPDKPTLKGDVGKWMQTLAANDAEYGRDSKDNPNNKPNGKWR